MEFFLHPLERQCPKCATQFRFRKSRYGCVFICECRGVFVEMTKVLKAFKFNVMNGTREVPFLPHVCGPPVLATITYPRIRIELRIAERQVRISGAFLPDGALESLLHGLPLALRSQRVDGGESDRNAQEYVFPVELVDVLSDELSDALREWNASEAVPQLDRVPRSTLRYYKDQSAAPLRDLHANVELLYDKVPVALRTHLHKHQREGVRRGIALGGRVLFADEMGVGKTLQAIATVSAFEAFPLLIVCPAAMREIWAEEVERWLADRVSLDRLVVVYSSNDALPTESSADCPDVVITSYHMSVVLKPQLMEVPWRCVIADESQVLHTNDSGHDATYTNLVCALGRRAPHCLFLSGTPSLVSPFDMFNQVDVLCPGLLGEDRYDFALQYCSLEFSPYLHVGECTRPQELHSLLQSACMIRRLKAEVLTDLPSKQRVVFRVPQVPEPPSERGVKDNAAFPVPSFQSAYSRAWQSKLPSILQVVSLLMTKHSKLVLFAHHVALLHVLETHLSRHTVNFVRIDGSTPAVIRPRLLASFNSGTASVALLGVTACAVGVSFTAAHCAVFCELPPDAAWAQQAEDRLHRYGQTEQVCVYYIVGTFSPFDARHFALLCRAAETVREVTDGTKISFSMTGASTKAQNATKEIGGETSHERTQTTALEPPTPPVLLRCGSFKFRVSAQTGRIHVADSEEQHVCSFSLDEAALVTYTTNGGGISNSSSLFSQLHFFEQFLQTLSPFHYRQLVRGNRWLRIDELSGVRDGLSRGGHTHIATPTAKQSFRRYTEKQSVFGPCFVYRVYRQKHVTEYLAGIVRTKRGGRRTRYLARCLQCQKPHATPKPIFPGMVYEANTDVAMFCRGSCREQYFVLRSSSAIRHVLRRADSGICSLCHVNCEELAARLNATESVVQREQIVRATHPLLASFPALFRRLISHPTSGNCWHADHIVPVSQGGGEASVSNLQTLCVACHAMKTTQEASGLLVSQRQHQGAPCDERFPDQRSPGPSCLAPDAPLGSSSSTLDIALSRLMISAKRTRRTTAGSRTPISTKNFECPE